jgi:hypothetical protein
VVGDDANSEWPLLSLAAGDMGKQGEKYITGFESQNSGDSSNSSRSINIYSRRSGREHDLHAPDSVGCLFSVGRPSTMIASSVRLHA